MLREHNAPPRTKQVFLQALAYAPEDEEPGMKLNAIRSEHREG
jgi:hypothetical protein